MTAEGQETYEMVITERTQWQDHDEKTTSDPATLAVGGADLCGARPCRDDVAAAAVGGLYRHPQFPRGTDLEQEARDAACPVKQFFARTRKAIEDWFYQTMPIAE